MPVRDPTINDCVSRCKIVVWHYDKQDTIDSGSGPYDSVSAGNSGGYTPPTNISEGMSGEGITVEGAINPVADVGVGMFLEDPLDELAAGGIGIPIAGPGVPIIYSGGPAYTDGKEGLGGEGIPSSYASLGEDTITTTTTESDFEFGGGSSGGAGASIGPETWTGGIADTPEAKKEKEKKKPTYSDDSDSDYMKVTEYTFDSEDLENPIIGFNYTKARMNALGEFNLHLAGLYNIHQCIAPGDWVGIYLTQGNHKWSLRCLGNVNRVEKIDHVAKYDGSRRITFSVSGYDFGKVFHRAIIYINNYIGEGVTSFGSFFKKLMNTNDVISPPDAAISAFLELIIGTNSTADSMEMGVDRISQWKVPDKMAQKFGGASNQRFNDILAKKFGKMPPADTIVSANLMSTTSLWQLMQYYANLPINELYAELDGPIGQEKPTLFLRNKPYTFKSYKDPMKLMDDYLEYFLDLDEVAIDRSNVYSSRLGVADHERFNVFMMDCALENFGLESTAMIIAKWGFPKSFNKSIERYGTFPLLNTTKFGFISDVEEVKWEYIGAWNFLSANWHANQHRLYNGTIQMIGDPNLRVGKRLTLKADGDFWKYDQSFYVEQYSDEWRFPGFWTQMAMVTRGIAIVNNKETYIDDSESLYDMHIGSNHIGGLKQ